MNVKTITGPSIHAALVEARKLFGDEVVLLQSVPPLGDEPARVTVLADASAVPKPAPVAALEVAQPAFAGYGYAAQSRPAGNASFTEDRAGAAESFSRPNGQAAPQTQGSHRGFEPETPRSQGSAGRGQLFPSSGEAVPGAQPPQAAASTARLEKLFEAQLQLLHERLDQMERRFNEAVVGASHQWGAHPLFGQLLEHGLRPATVASLFDQAAAQGLTPDSDPMKLRWTVAHALRERLGAPSSWKQAGTQVFIGPSGAGKTSLLLKLATHPTFYARRRTGILVIVPEEEDAPFQSPVELYRRHGLPVQTVRTEREMAEALQRFEGFDHILVDTPPMPAHEAGARKMLARVRRLLDGVMPLDVQFVLNATRSLDAFDPAFLDRLPLRPTAAALTHLDETLRWGRVAEWLMALRLPVHVVANGPSMPALSAFSATWFVEKIMEL